ncbi:hypothetical protein SBI_09487 [Streptomyces bingchenggensis BCW-1]|uniref:Uncharacterized protein n=1 Tax=Streptomyces bingchenggensis (strain BCW-1) TaxID=749414 RepID=D7C7Q7_STRBB|nr:MULTISPECIES: hypothetical protein [Streptomyces]ADI12605.1 hypothetical protein SBI_09487 [Streptomyces bingchenggensis BCW-1]
MSTPRLTSPTNSSDLSAFPVAPRLHGLSFGELRSLAARIHDLGACSYLEVVGVNAADELRSLEAAVGLGVDVVLGGTRVAEGVKILDGAPVEYWPFPGRVAGHPSILCGDAADIVASAKDLAATTGVHGLDLLAYRFGGDAAALAAQVVTAVDVPVLAAGSVDRAERIAALRDAGVWGFTVGTAVLDGSFPWRRGPADRHPQDHGRGSRPRSSTSTGARPVR